MAHFAKIDENNIVETVIVVSNESCGNLEFPESEPIGQAFIASIGLEGNWKQTSYNTSGNQHSYGKTPFRGNYASIGSIYDPIHDAFYDQQISQHAVLNTLNFQWVLPFNDSTQSLEPNESWKWDEETGSWVILQYDISIPTRDINGEIIQY
jgi:hypothetical protein